MTINKEDLDKLKQIYFKHYAERLNDDEVLALGTRLISLFEIIAKPLPAIDMVSSQYQNKAR